MLEDRGCSHYHVVCVISRLAAAVGRLHRLPCCQHYSLPPSPAITHHTTHTRRRDRYMCGCAWPRQNAAELHASIHIHNLHSIELKSNQSIDNWEWWRKEKKLFCTYPWMLLRWINSMSQINWQLNHKCVQCEYRERFCITATLNHTQGLGKQINKACHESMGGWWRPEMIRNLFNCQKDC